MIETGSTLKVSIRPWGNSQGIRLPKEIMQYMNYSVNDQLTLEICSNGILLKKNAVRKTLQEYSEPYGGLGKYKEFDWGEGIGFDRFLDE